MKKSIVACSSQLSCTKQIMTTTHPQIFAYAWWWTNYWTLNRVRCLPQETQCKSYLHVNELLATQQDAQSPAKNTLWEQPRYRMQRKQDSYQRLMESLSIYLKILKKYAIEMTWFSLNERCLQNRLVICCLFRELSMDSNSYSARLESCL